jgi:hypothetical protein
MWPTHNLFKKKNETKMIIQVYYCVVGMVNIIIIVIVLANALKQNEIIFV